MKHAHQALPEADKVALVKSLRQLTGCGLFEAKQCLEAKNWDMRDAYAYYKRTYAK